MVIARTRTVTLTIDGTQITVPEGTTIWDAARDAGIDIPVLCHDERYDPVGVCRMCVVDVGARVYAAACVRPCEDGMDVKTATADVERSRATLTELLLADQPPADRDPKQTTTGDNALLALADRYGVSRDGVGREGVGREGVGRDRVGRMAGCRLRPRHGHLEPGDRRRPRRLHPV